jgi:hypothetical protein
MPVLASAAPVSAVNSSGNACGVVTDFDIEVIYWNLLICLSEFCVNVYMTVRAYLNRNSLNICLHEEDLY